MDSQELSWSSNGFGLEQRSFVGTWATWAGVGAGTWSRSWVSARKDSDWDMVGLG